MILKHKEEKVRNIMKYQNGYKINNIKQIVREGKGNG